MQNSEIYQNKNHPTFHHHNFLPASIITITKISIGDDSYGDNDDGYENDDSDDADTGERSNASERAGEDVEC